MAGLAGKLRELGEIQVSDFDFMELLNKDVKELEISRSLKRWGSIRVMEWDFREVLPAVNKLAHQEVDVMDFLKRTAHYKILDWDFRASPAEETSGSMRQRVDAQEMQALILKLKNFLQYTVVELIDEPAHARIIAQEIAPGVLRFRLVMTRRDVAMLIGREGKTASAIRGVLKARAGVMGVHALLLIQTHEEEAAMREG